MASHPATEGLRDRSNHSLRSPALPRWRRVGLLGVAAACLAAAPAGASLDYPDFSDTTGLSLRGNAATMGASLQLTPESNDMVGAVWGSERQDVASGFTTTFRFEIHNFTPVPADGLALVIHNDPAGDAALGSAGLGYTGIAAGVLAVELDTFSDRGVELRTGVPDFDADGTTGVVAPGRILPPFNLWDGVARDMTIHYDADLSVVVVSIDDPTPGAADFHQVYALDLGPFLPADGMAWVGLVAMTGRFDSEHVVHGWTFESAGVADADMDGVADDEDNCPAAANPEQADLDGDGMGDVCDDDMDGDEVSNLDDNCMAVFNPDQADMDGDAIGDVCDEDVDGDEIANADDNCALDPNGDQMDFDGDALGDACDDDADADGLPDADGDFCPLSPLDEVVDASGCTLGQYVPCDGIDGRPWVNHGQYMRRISRTAKRFRLAGLMTHDEVHEVTSAAAQSECGQSMSPPPPPHPHPHVKPHHPHGKPHSKHHGPSKHGYNGKKGKKK